MELFIGIIIVAVIAWSLIKGSSSNNNKPRFTVTTTMTDDDSDDASLDDRDNWEGFNYYQSVSVPASGRYRIKYTDQSGMKTEREIIVKRVYDDRSMYAIKAHCMMRNANRSFLDDRIQSATNLDTGEVVGSVARDAIQQFAVSDEGIAYEHERMAMEEIGKEWAGICILMFVAKADGQMVKKERAIVAEYLKAYCQGKDIRDDALDNMIKQLGAPDQREFKNLVKQIKGSGDVVKLKLLLACAGKIVGTGKTVAPFEKAALEVLHQAIG